MNTIVLKDLLAKELIRKLDKKASIFPIANRAFEWTIKWTWTDTVSVQELPSFDMDLWVTLWDDVTAEDWAVTSYNLVIDQAANKLLKVKDIEEVRTNFNANWWLADRLAEAVRRMYDQFTAVQVRNADASVKIQDWTPQLLDKDSVIWAINEMAQKLEEQNVEVSGWNVKLYINPAVKNLINNSNLVTWFDKWYDSKLKWTVWMIAWFDAIMTSNLPFKQKVTFTWTTTADDFITINWVTFTFVASPSAAWDVDIAWTAAGTLANLVAAVNWWAWEWTAYKEITSADRKIISSVFVNAWTDWAITAWKYIEIAKSSTHITLVDASRIMFAAEVNAINVAAQMTWFKITEAEKGFYSNVLTEHAFWWALLGSNTKRVATYDIKNWVSVA